MSSVAMKLKPGRFIWTVLVTFYFLVFFRNFFSDAAPGRLLLQLLFAYAFVLWLAVEYYFGSPFFQSGVVEHSSFWRGVFAFFVYPYLGCVAADYIWWNRTQIPVAPVLWWVLGMAAFGVGTYIRLKTLFVLQQLTEPGRGRFSERRFLELPFQNTCRHPRYLATLLQIVGAAFAFCSWGGLVLVLVLGLPLVLVQAWHEDRALRRTLKAEYQSYSEKTPLLLPRLGRTSG